MSSFIMKAESIATIADFIYSVYEYGYNGCNMSFNDDTRKAIFNACNTYTNQPQCKITTLNHTCKILQIQDIVTVKNIFEALSEMNCSAVNQRYKEHDFITESFTDNYTRFERPNESTYNDGIFEIPASYYQLLKSIDCYLYQCSEGNVPELALYKAVEDIRAMLANWIIRNTTAYNEAKWG